MTDRGLVHNIVNMLKLRDRLILKIPCIYLYYGSKEDIMTTRTRDNNRARDIAKVWVVADMTISSISTFSISRGSTHGQDSRPHVVDIYIQ